MDNLIEKLRELGTETFGYDPDTGEGDTESNCASWNLVQEAADALEEKDAEIADQRRKLIECDGYSEGLRQGWADCRNNLKRDEKQTLADRAEVERLRGELVYARKLMDEMLGTLSGGPAFDLNDVRGFLARTAP